MRRFLAVVRNVSVSLSAFVAFVWIAGCSSSTTGLPKKLVPVEGKVVLDGVPLTGANVIFIPKDQTKGTGGLGVTDSEGHYQARHMSNKLGIEPGTYQVLFSKIGLPDGSPIPPDRSAAEMGAVETLPPQLSSPPPDMVIHKAAISESGGTFDFNLASK